MCGCVFGACDSDDHDEEKNFRQVSITRRKCTDTFCLLIFGSFLAIMLIIGVYGYTHGDLYEIIYGTDSFGGVCNRKNPNISVILDGKKDFYPFGGNDLRDKKYLFPMDITHPLKTAWICVDKCPTKTLATMSDIHEHARVNGTDYCMYPKIKEQFQNKELSSNTGVCPSLPVLKSVPILNRCVPEALLEGSSDLFENFAEMINNVDFVRGVIQDLVLVWREILFISLMSLGVSLLMVFLIRFFAPIIVYLIYALVVISAVSVSGFLWYFWYDASTKVDSLELTLIPEGTIVNRLSWEINFDARTLLGLAIVSSIITIFLTLVVWCLWPRGALIIDLFKQAGKACQKMPSLLFQPVITSIALLLFLSYWCLVFAYLYTSADPYFHLLDRIDSSPSNPQEYDKLPIIKYEIYPILRYMLWIHVFGLIWVSEFIFASQRMVIAGAIACWYFARDRNAIGSPCAQSIHILYRYHLGSIAFGSLIITAVKFPRYVFMYIYAKMSASKNFIVKAIFACLIGLLKCIEKCLRYLHHNAYTVIAISGQSFCPAAKTATNILIDNAVSVATINTVGDFVLFLAKSMVTFAVACFAGYSFHSNPNVTYWYVCTGICAAIAYFIANCFVSVFEMIVDTLFLCYAEETAMISRSNGSQNYADAEFHDFMNSTLQRERNYRRVPADGGDVQTRYHRDPVEGVEIQQSGNNRSGV